MTRQASLYWADEETKKESPISNIDWDLELYEGRTHY